MSPLTYGAYVGFAFIVAVVKGLIAIPVLLTVSRAKISTCWPTFAVEKNEIWKGIVSDPPAPRAKSEVLPHAPIILLTVPESVPCPLSWMGHQLCVVFSYCNVISAGVWPVTVLSLSDNFRLDQLSPVEGFARRTLNVVGFDVPWIAVAGKFVLTVGFGWTE
jgi:hypothetical protein